MAKVVLTKDESDALKYAINEHGKEGVIRAHTQDGDWTDACDPLNSISVLDLVNAVINGWEVENSPIDDLREKYIEYSSTPSNVYCCAWRDGVVYTLNAIGKVVKGINDR